MNFNNETRTTQNIFPKKLKLFSSERLINYIRDHNSQRILENKNNSGKSPKMASITQNIHKSCVLPYENISTPRKKDPSRIIYMKIARPKFHLPSIPHINSKYRPNNFCGESIRFTSLKLSDGVKGNIIGEDKSPGSGATTSTSQKSSYLLPDFSTVHQKVSANKGILTSRECGNIDHNLKRYDSLPISRAGNRMNLMQINTPHNQSNYMTRHISTQDTKFGGIKLIRQPPVFGVSNPPQTLKLKPLPSPQSRYTLYIYIHYIYTIYIHYIYTYIIFYIMHREYI